MKTTKISSTKTLLRGFALAGMLAVFPLTTFAASATSSSSVYIGRDGIVHVINAEVTAISGNIISAVTNFKNTVINWSFATNASTTVASGGVSATTSTSGIHIGDTLHVTGTLGSIGSTIGVTAAKVRDMTTAAFVRTMSGTVQSINISNGTFVLKSDDKLITVWTNASTTFVLGSGTTIAATTLVNLPIQGRVTVAGVISADKASITASKVTLFLGERKTDDEKDKEDKKTSFGEHKGFKLGWFFHGKHFER